MSANDWAALNLGQPTAPSNWGMLDATKPPTAGSNAAAAAAAAAAGLNANPLFPMGTGFAGLGATGAGLGAAPTTGAPTGTSGSTEPSSSLEISNLVTDYFADLTAQHGGQLPINQAALDALISSASAMPAGPEQQQQLALINMLLQLHTGQQAPTLPTPASAGQGVPTQQASPPSAFQPHLSPQLGGLNTAPSAFDQQWSNALTAGTNTAAASALNAAALGTPTFGAFGSGLGATNAFLNLDAAASALAAGGDRRAANASEEPALAGVPNTNDWMMNMTHMNQLTAGNSTAANATAAAGALHDFASPLRPARTTAGTGYTDVPDAGSPFSYEPYTNLSVTARPFQPTSSSASAEKGTAPSTSTTSPSQLGQPASAASLSTANALNNAFTAAGTAANNLLLQQQLSAQLTHQTELNASLAALQGVTAANSRAMFADLTGLGGAHANGLAPFDPTDPLASLSLGGASGLNPQHRLMDLDDSRDRRHSEDFNPHHYGAPAHQSAHHHRDGYDRHDRDRGYGPRYGGHQGSYGGGLTNGTHNDRRGGRLHDYAHSGMDRFDYIKHELNQAQKTKTRGYDEAAMATGRPGFGSSTSSGSRGAYLPDFATPNQLQSLQAQPTAGVVGSSGGISQQQLAQILAQSITGSNADTVTASGTNAAASSTESGVLSAEAALKSLTASPEYHALSPQQQAQIYLSVHQVQERQTADAAAALAAATAAASAAVPNTNSLVGNPSVAATAPTAMLGALQSPLSSTVVNITPGTRVEDVLAKIMKPDLEKLNAELRRQRATITNVALGQSSTPAAVHVPVVPATDAEPTPMDKSKMRPPKMRSGPMRRTEFPDATSTEEAKKASPTPDSASTTSSSSAAATVGPIALNQLQSVISNSAMSRSAQVAVIRNVLASASATALAQSCVNAFVPQAAKEEVHAPATTAPQAPTSAKQTEPAAPTAASIVAAAPSGPTMAMRVRKRHVTAAAPGAATNPATPTGTPGAATTEPAAVTSPTAAATTIDSDSAAVASTDRSRGGRNGRGENNRRNNPRQPRNQPRAAADSDDAPSAPGADDATAGADSAAASSGENTNRRGGDNNNRRRNQRGGGRQPRKGANDADGATIPAGASDGAAAAASTTEGSASDPAASPPSAGRQRGGGRRGEPRAPRAPRETGDGALTSNAEGGDAAAPSGERKPRNPRGGSGRQRGGQRKEKAADGAAAVVPTSAPSAAAE